jgi:hypothetical protein
MELFASTLIFDSNSLFYLTYLASNKLSADVNTAIALVDDILQAIIEIGYQPTKITQTSLLSDAAAHLTTMDTILSQTGSVTQKTQNNVPTPSVVTTPYDQYATAVDAFRDIALKPNIKKGTQIVRSAQEARNSATTSLATLKDLYPDILSRVAPAADNSASLTNVVAVYHSLQLQSFALQRSLRQARGDLLSLQKELEDPTTTDVQKTALTRDAYLRITAGKSVITGLKDASNPTEARMQSGPSITGNVSINPASTFTVASVTTSPGPWSLQTGVTDTLIIAEDSNTPTTYTIPVPVNPSVVSSVSASTFDIIDITTAILTSAVEPFTIPTITNSTFYVTVDGILFSGPLTTGVDSADQIVSDLSLLVDANANLLTTKLNISNIGNAVVLECLEAGQHNIHISDSDQVSHAWLAALGFSITSVTGRAANNLLYIDGNLLTLPTGIYTPTDMVNEINSLATTYSLPYHASLSGTFIEITKTGVGALTITMQLPAPVPSPTDLTRYTVAATYDTLGFYVGQTDSSNEVTATDLAIVINTVGKVLATVVRTHVGGATVEQVRIDSKLQSLGTLLTIGAGTANTLLGLTAGIYPGTTTGFTATASFEDADVEAGDQLTAGDVHTIASVSGNTLESSPPFPTNTVVSFFEIESADFLSYNSCFALTDSVWSDWYTNNLNSPAHTKYSKDTSELDRLMNSVIGNITPTQADRNAATVGAQAIHDILTNQPSGGQAGLYEVLASFTTRRSARIDAAINMLQERGFDQAYTTLLRGDLASFFGYDKDDAASASSMLKTMRSLVQNDLPVTNKSDSIDDTALDSSVQTSDANYDRSDVDKDENLNLLGSVPDLDTDTIVPADYTKQVF